MTKKAKVLINAESKFLVSDTSKDYHTQYGRVLAEDLKNSTGTIITNMNTTFSCFDATFIDLYEKMHRQAQIITLKDIGVVIAETGVNKDSVILEAGSGSGAFGCFMANLCKTVYSYDIREDHQKTAKKNAEMFNLKNIHFKIGDVREGISETDLDLVLLDMPDPWVALEKVAPGLVKGGFLVVYSPTIPQVMDTVEKASESCKDSLIFLKTIETIQRGWDVIGRKVRPASSYINHTGFLTFFRKI